MVNDKYLDLRDFSKELRLLIVLIKTEGSEQLSPGDKQLFSDVDWNLVIKLAVHHRVFPIVYLSLKKLDNNWVPQSVVETLQKFYYKNTFQMLYLSREMERICKLFAEANLRILVLKGPVLADDLYGDVSQRTSVDLDVLISINDLDEIDKFLIEAGYNKEQVCPTVLNEWKWRHHHINYVHSQSMFKLEVHWRLSKGPGKEPVFDELWDRKRVSRLTNHPVYYLGKEDLFLYLVTHGSRHGWSRLGWLVDIHKLLQQNLDLEILYRLLNKYQRLHIAGQALILSSDLLNTSITEPSKTLRISTRSEKLAEDALFYIRRMVNLHSDPVPEDVRQYHKKHLFALMSRQQKILFVLNFLYPYPMDAEILPLPKCLHFLYFPLRPVLWAWRKTRNNALT